MSNIDVETSEMKLTAIFNSVKELQQFSDTREMDMSIAKGDIYEFGGNNNGSWIVDLPNNLFCPICEQKHDEPYNFLTVDMGNISLLCRFEKFRNSIAMLSVNEYEHVIKHFDMTTDSVLNKLLVESFNGNSYNVAKVIHHLGRRIMGLESRKYVNCWLMWSEYSKQWEENFHQVNVFLSEDIRELYDQCQFWFLRNIEDKRLGKVMAEKVDLISQSLSIWDTWNFIYFLKYAAEIFRDQEEPIDKKLENNPNLLGFEGELYTLRK